MTDPSRDRLSSAYMDDLIYIALSARPNDEGFALHPDLDESMRARLRSRIKQLGRYDWPSSMRDDPAFRRGYTLRQCYRLVTAVILLDAYLPPSLVVLLAQNNEVSFFRAIAQRLHNPSERQASPNDLIAMIVPGEIRDALAFADWSSLDEHRVRLIQRHDLAEAWSGNLAQAGPRLAVDVATAALAVWRWISERRLLDDTVRQVFLAEVDSLDPEAGYEPVARMRRRR